MTYTPESLYTPNTVYMYTLYDNLHPREPVYTHN